MATPIQVLRDAFGSSSTAVVAAGSSLMGDVYLGHHVTVYPAVCVETGCIIMDGAVLGRIPIANRSTTLPVRSEFSELLIGAGTIVGCNSVLYTGSRVGNRVMIGDLTSIREGANIGDDVVLGRGVMLLANCKIGARTRIQDQAHIVGNMIVEEDVFIGMGVITTNDNDVYTTRFGATAADLKPPTIRRLAVIGAGATILPGVEIGMGAMVGAGAVITKDVPAWTVVAGVPAHFTRNIPDEWRRQVQASGRGD